MARVRADQVTDVVAHHGEGPAWDAATGRMCMVDMLCGDVMSFDPDGRKVTRTPVGPVAACVVPRAGGGLAVATERGFTLIDANGARDVLPDVWSDPSVRMNDGGCDPHGRFFCGSMAYDAAGGRGALYRLDPDRSVHLAIDEVTISNGIGWSPDGATAYYVDTPTRRVDAFAYEGGSGRLSERCPAVDLTDVTGVPDGIAVDAEGGIWVALWGGRAVHRYLHGTLALVVELPVRQVTSCAFGGEALDALYITTSAEGLEDPEPAAGAVFAIEPGVRGLAPNAYGG